MNPPSALGLNERDGSAPWWRGLDRTMWWVLAVAALGWLFDVMDQRIFTVSRPAALDELLAVEVEESALRAMSAGEAANLLGEDAGVAPEAKVVIKEPDENNRGVFLVLPPAKADAAPRKHALVRRPGSTTVEVAADSNKNNFYGSMATAFFLAGWAAGGLVFGILGDKLGRVRTMAITILIYSAFTGLSALSVTWMDYSLYRFMTGLGVGGEFAAGASLVAEVMPDRARPYALGLLQALSAVGNILGALLAYFILEPSDAATEWQHWRSLYLVGILPALLVFVVLSRLKEPARWQAAKESAGEFLGKRLGSFGDLFQPRWRQSTVFGLLFAVSGVIGLWGVAFFTPELLKETGASGRVISFAFALQDVGALFGIAAITLFTQGAARERAGTYTVGLIASIFAAGACLALGAGTATDWQTAGLGVALSLVLYFTLALLGALWGGFGRRMSFCLSFLMALGATFMVFGLLNEPGQVYWMIPVLGFSTLATFGMYAIYFPELYPTRLRATGTGFCYNVARFFAAGGLFLKSYLLTLMSFRESALLLASIYLVGAAASLFAPETKDKPLPEE